MDRVQRLRRTRRDCRSTLCVLQGIDLAGGVFRAAIGGCAGDGVARRRPDARGSGFGRGSLHMARGFAVARFQLLAGGDRGRRAPDRARLSPGRVAGAQAMTTLVVRGLSKRYGGVLALRGVSFSVASGELVAIIGPNGAGKTTCFNLLNGQLGPDSGEIELDGEPLAGRAPRDIW